MNDQRKSAYDTVSDRRAVEMYRDDDERSLKGERLASAETDPSADRTKAIAELAVEQPERFLELVGYLPHVIQDVFYQYYLLGRTGKQISRVLEMSPSSSGKFGVTQRLQLGIAAICAIIAFGRPPRDEDWRAAEGSRKWKLLEAWREMERVEAKTEAELRVRAPKGLGEFEVRIEDEALAEFFAPASKDWLKC